MMKEIDTLNQEIKSAEKEMLIAEGKRESMTENLKKEFDITPEMVEKSLKKMSGQLEAIWGKIEEKFDKLKEEYEW